MKKILATLASCVLLSLFLSPAMAKSGPDKVVTGQTAENLRNVLANLGWIADGKDQGKHLYVLFSTSCIYCSVLFETTRKVTDQVQLRWVPISVDGDLDYMYDHPHPDTLAAGFTGRDLPESGNKESIARTRQYSMGGIRFLLAARMLTDGPPSGFALPTLVYSGKENVSVIAGMPPDINAVIKDIQQGKADAPDFVPAAYKHANKDIEVLPMKKGEYFNRHNGDMPIFLTPFEGSPKMGSILAGNGQGVPALGMTKDGYVLLSIDGKNTVGFIQDKAFVDKMLAGE